MLIVAGSKAYDEAEWLLSNGAAEVNAPPEAGHAL